MDYSAYHNVLTMYEISVCFSVYLSENIMLCIHVKHFLSCCLHPLVPPSLLFDISRLSKAIFPCSPPLELYTILSEKGIRKLLVLHPCVAFHILLWKLHFSLKLRTHVQYGSFGWGLKENCVQKVLWW